MMPWTDPLAQHRQPLADCPCPYCRVVRHDMVVCTVPGSPHLASSSRESVDPDTVEDGCCNDNPRLFS